MKTDVFQRARPVRRRRRAILASNTSSIPIMKLGIATQRPEQVIGIHFFNPVPVLRLVELVTSLMTSPETIARASSFATDVLGKRVIRSQDRAGFVVNALLIPYLLSAIRMMESGFATADDIDTGMVEGCNHPMGPLRLTDLIGLDTTLAVAQSLYEEFKEPLYAPRPCCRAWSTPVCSDARPVAGSTSTARLDGRAGRAAHQPARPAARDTGSPQPGRDRRRAARPVSREGGRPAPRLRARQGGAARDRSADRAGDRRRWAVRRPDQVLDRP